MINHLPYLSSINQLQTPAQRSIRMLLSYHPSIIPTLLTIICTTSVCATPPAAHANGISDPPGSMGDDDSESVIGIYVWGPMRYVRGSSSYDHLTTVEGGAIGSALLAIQEPETQSTVWYFIDGEYLFVNPRHFPPSDLVTERGMMIRSHRSKAPDAPQQANHRNLTEMLVDVYQRTYWSSHPARHAPFLTGNGWPNNGASLAEAQAYARQLDLGLKISGPHQTGYVNTQLTTPGTPMPLHGQIEVQLDGQTIPNPGDPLGSATNPAIATANSQHAARITLHHDDIHTPANARGAGPDYWIKLPNSARGKLVTVTQSPGHAANILLNHITTNTGTPPAKGGAGSISNTTNTSTGIRPRLRFTPTTDTSKDVYIVLEHRDRRFGTIYVNINW